MVIVSLELSVIETPDNETKILRSDQSINIFHLHNHVKEDGCNILSPWSFSITKPLPFVFFMSPIATGHPFWQIFHPALQMCKHMVCLQIKEWILNKETQYFSIIAYAVDLLFNAYLMWILHAFFVLTDLLTDESQITRIEMRIPFRGINVSDFFLFTFTRDSYFKLIL